MSSRMQVSVLLLLILAGVASGQLERRRHAMSRVARSVDGVVGVAVVDLTSGDTLFLNENRRFPMQSVYKFPIGLAVLDLVQKGELSLDQVLRLTPADLLPNTWSPLREAHPHRTADLTLDSVIAATVSWSDNNGCDILLRAIGGPARVDRYVRELGIEGMAIVSTEAEMHRDDSAQYRNFSTPKAMARLLQRFAAEDLLSKPLHAYLWRLMVETPTGAKRLKGALPSGAIVAHKTGSSGTNAAGIAAATNDAGILVLPDGRRVVVVVFVSDSRSSESEREGVIASIAQIVWESYHP